MSKLTLQQANTIIARALAKAREMKIKPLGVVVLDDAGNIKSAQREDAERLDLHLARLGEGFRDDGVGLLQCELGHAFLRGGLAGIWR